MSSKTIKKITKPEIDTGFAEFIDITQLYKEGTSELTENYLLKFYSQRGKFFTAIVSNEPNKNKPDIPSRYEQLAIESKINIGDFVQTSIAKIKADITGYLNEDGNLIPYKEDRIEIKKLKLISSDIFKERHQDFIITAYEKEIIEKVKNGLPFDSAVKMQISQHREKQDNNA